MRQQGNKTKRRREEEVVVVSKDGSSSPGTKCIIHGLHCIGVIPFNCIIIS